MDVTQATVSRDIAELGLVKVPRGDRHGYMSPADLAPAPAPSRRRAASSYLCGHPGHRRSERAHRCCSRRRPGRPRARARRSTNPASTNRRARSRATTRSSSVRATRPRLERWLDRFAAIRAAERSRRHPALGRPRVRRTAPHPHGGLLDEQGRPRLLGRARYVGRGRVAARAVRRRGRHAHRRSRRRVAARRRGAARDVAPARPAPTSSMRASAS